MKQTTLIGMVVSLIAVLFLAGAYAVVFLETAKLQKTAQSLSVEIIQATHEHAKRGENKHAIDQIRFDEEEIASHVLPPSSIVSFLEGIETKGDAFGSDVAVVSVTDPSPDGRITVALSVVGSFEAVMRTVGYIEHDTYASVTKSLSLDSVDGDFWSAALTMHILTKKTP